MPSSELAIGNYRHLVSLANPGALVPDGDGGWTEGYAPLAPPTMWAHIDPATAADMETNTAGTVISMSTHIIRMAFHPGVTTKTRITWGEHVYEVTGTRNPELRERELVLVCEEIVE